MNCFFLLFFFEKPVALIKTKIVTSHEQNTALGSVRLSNSYDSHSSREPENTALLINMIGTPAIANISLDPG